MKKHRGRFATFFKQKRKETGLTQQQLADKAGVGLRFIRDVEQGKKSIQLNKVDVVLELFGYCAGPVRGRNSDDCVEEGHCPS